MSNYDDLPLFNLDLDVSDEVEQTTQPELLTIKLFKQAIQEAEDNQKDALLQRFAEYVLPNLMRQLVGTTAKGGQFTEDRRAEGKNVERSKEDQSFTSHLLNGLFPTYRIFRKLQQTLETNPVKRLCEELEASIYMAAYILHDFDKFPDYPNWLTANDPSGQFSGRDWRKEPPHKSEAPNLGRDYISQKMQDLGLDQLIGSTWRSYIDDILWISNNAGEKWDADLGMKTRGLDQCQLDERIQQILIRLVRLSDLFASVIKHPGNITANNFTDLLRDLSARQLRFSYHALSDNRGVLTNVINNALMDLHPQEFYQPILYLPDGVVYLATEKAPEISVNTIPEQVIHKIKSLCGGQLKQRQTGFARGGKGFKFADYYWLFCNASEIMAIAKQAACRIIPATKPSIAAKRSDSLLSFQAEGELPSNINLSFRDDYRIDRLGEFGDVLCRGIWRTWCDRFTNWQKQLPKSERKVLPELDLTQKIAEHLGLGSEMAAVRAIQALKKTGGVPLEWYYLASRYIQQNMHLDDAQIQAVMDEMVTYAATLIEPIVQEFVLPDGWDDLRTYVQRVVILPTGAVATPTSTPFLTELDRYKAAKVTGRGRENVCAMSSSSYTVSEQMESATLFTPQVYSNRQILFNAQAAKRQICAIWSIEMMLRQILMNQTNATGGDFEGRKYRYLYIYPAYFFTPETNKFLQKAYAWIRRTKFDADIRKHLVPDKKPAQFTIENYQSVDSLLLQEESDKDQTFKLNYPNEPLTFFFMALPPGRDATDTESWVMPSWLAFALPLVLDVKVVASESPVPPYISGADFEQTTVLDGEHQAISTLVKRDNYRLDAILPRQPNRFSPLNALSAAYCIHLEVNRKKDGDPDWGKLTALARDIETSPLYIFHYLSKLVRKLDWDTAPVEKIKLYQDFYYCFDPEGKDMNQLRQLTQLYRRFYRAKSRYAKPNAVLKPIDEAADVILKIDKALASETQSLIDVVAARIAKLMTNVSRGTAEGKPTLIFVDGKWKRALTSEEERKAIYEFAQFFVTEVFEGTFKSDRARLAGTQLNLIRDTCDYLYRLEEDAASKSVPASEPEDLPELEDEAA
ncbi:type I-D CRISPR-associated protein Cas10d/Csc3 [Alkalinema pantanalense CENA528]|uniref:type I-D CRISPR-associated protein Cas10d/Csc3 n=1 Tax=Alkalinema pantanalense TaxID=1620705 RepID=UPI003D6FA6D3